MCGILGSTERFQTDRLIFIVNMNPGAEKTQHNAGSLHLNLYAPNRHHILHTTSNLR